MAKITVSTITNGQNVSAINENFSEIADALNNKALYRNNPAGEANQMQNDLDMNSNDILNVDRLYVQNISIAGKSVDDELEAAIAASEAAQASAVVAGVSAQAASVSASQAASSASGAAATLANALVKTNNLSDLSSISTAKTNLALNNVDNTSDVNKPVSTAQATAIALKLDKAGITNGSATPAGVHGEVIEDTVTSGALVTGTFTAIKSITLTAGIWRVEGSVTFIGAGTTTISRCSSSVHTVSATNPGSPYYADNSFGSPVVGAPQTQEAPSRILNVTTNTTVYLNAYCTYATSTLTVNGFIRAIRL